MGPNGRWRLAIAAGALLLLIVGCAARSAEPPERRAETVPRAHPPVERFLDCLSMWRSGWVEGVTLWGSGETYPSRWAEAQKQTYRLNRHLAASILGEACHPPETYQHIDGRAKVTGWIRTDELEDDP